MQHLESLIKHPLVHVATTAAFHPYYPYLHPHGLCFNFDHINSFADQASTAIFRFNSASKNFALATQELKLLLFGLLFSRKQKLRLLLDLARQLFEVSILLLLLAF